MTRDYLTCSAAELPSAVREVLDSVQPLGADRLATAAQRQADLTKPAGALGHLELAVNRICAIGSTLSPRIDRPYVVVFAADHGVAHRGVSAWPQDVTAQMFSAVTSGKAAINVIARSVGADVAAVNMGLATAVSAPTPATDVTVVQRPLGAGTADCVAGPAMSVEVAQRGFLCGAQIAHQAVDAGATLLVAGDLGIANTCSSATLIALIMGIDPQIVTGRGAGADDEVYQAKLEAVQAAVVRHRDTADDGWAALAAVGGFEHCAMAGFYAAAASRSVPVVLDGVISCAAATVVAKMRRAVADYMIAGHRSVEPGATAALTYLGLEPVVDGNWRLGEGTGAALAIPVLQAGCATMTEMARFSSFAVAGATAQPDGGADVESTEPHSAQGAVGDAPVGGLPEAAVESTTAHQTNTPPASATSNAGTPEAAAVPDKALAGLTTATPAVTTGVLAGLALPGPVPQENSQGTDPATAEPALTPMSVTVVPTDPEADLRPQSLANVVVGNPHKTVDYTASDLPTATASPSCVNSGLAQIDATPLSPQPPNPEHHHCEAAQTTATQGRVVGSAPPVEEPCPDTEQVLTVAPCAPADGDFVGADYEVDLRQANVPASPSW